MSGKTQRDRVSARGFRRRRAGRGPDRGNWDGTLAVAESLDALDRRECDALFVGELENGHYLRALERARLERYEPLYFVVRIGGRIVAVVPAFIGPARPSEPSAAAETLECASGEPSLTLGSALGDVCRAGFSSSWQGSQTLDLLSRVLHAARDLAASRHLGGVRVAAIDEPRRPLWRRACERVGLIRIDSAPFARLTLPAWSLDDYVSVQDSALRDRLWRACERAASYERRWCVDFSRDVERILALCADVGVIALNAAGFAELLQPSMVCARCLTVHLAGDLVGFSLVLHDARRLREKLTVVRSCCDSELVRSLIWLETVCFGLERGIDTFESSSPLSIAAAKPNELLRRAVWSSDPRRGSGSEPHARGSHSSMGLGADV